MAPALWERVKAVFADTLEQPVEDRRAFVEQACSGDARLRDEVESLLAASVEPDPVIEKNAIDLGAMIGAGATSSMAGRQFGNYRIVREIGHGGMGAVFLAERADGAFHHEVAIKVIRQTLTDPDIERRFRRERQILASLNHPHIARLLDGGMTARGEPFIVMEFVDGEPLPEYASRARLDVDSRLALFQQVCEAVAYAHRKLVVHGDLKPSNIMVNAAGQPRLLDFGLATMLGIEDGSLGPQTAATGTLDDGTLRAFTPAYASPEQVRGTGITTSSDVYSLGVVLYELLSGERPFQFEHRSIEDIVRTFDSTSPPRPSDAVARRRTAEGSPTAATVSDARRPWLPQTTLRGDLDGIVLMALRKEPDQRYPSVEALAEDIQRHRDGWPVRARPQALSYRAARFVARNRVAAAAAVLVALSLIAGLAGSLWQASLAREQRDRANGRFDDVRRLSNSLLFELSPLIERMPGATEARDLLLHRAVDYLDSLAGESAGDQQLQGELAAGYEKIGDLQGNPSNPNLVDFDAAIDSYSKAGRIRVRLLEARPADPDPRRALAQNYRVLGNIHGQANNFEAASSDLDGALRSYEALLAEHPGDEFLELAVAQTRHDIGRNLSTTKRYAGSFPYFRKAIEIGEQMSQSAPATLEVARLVGDSHAQLGLALSWEGQQKEAEAEMASAVAIYEPLLLQHPDDVNVRDGLWSTFWLTSSVYEEQDDRLAEAFAAKALATIQPVVDQDPANIRARQQLAKSFSRLGQAVVNRGRPSEAVAYLEHSCRILREITATTSKNGRLRSELALAVTRLAEALSAQGQTQAALTQLAEAVGLYTQLRREFPEDRRSPHNLVLTYQLMGEIHDGDAVAHSGQERLAARQAAKDNYQNALDILLGLREQQALAAFDRTLLEKMQAAVAKHH